MKINNCELDSDGGINLLLFETLLFSFSCCLPLLLSLLGFKSEHLPIEV